MTEPAPLQRTMLIILYIGSQGNGRKGALPDGVRS
jgi:hypothetical protein